MIFLSLLLATLIQTKADVPRVTASELHALLARGEAVAVDVRGNIAYKYGHIADAVSMPLGTVEQRATELPQGKLIVTYCACRSEETSLEGAMLLVKHGFEKVAVLRGGIQAWTAAELPTVLERTVHFDAEREAAPAGGRLAPPSSVPCDRNDLTSYAGRVISYERTTGKTTLVIATSAGTTERVTLEHAGSEDPSSAFLLAGQAFAAEDWKKIEKSRGVLRDSMSVIAWVCSDGQTIVDWRPDAKFSGAE